MSFEDESDLDLWEQFNLNPFPLLPRIPIQRDLGNPDFNKKKRKKKNKMAKKSRRKNRR